MPTYRSNSFDVTVTSAAPTTYVATHYVAPYATVGAASDEDTQSAAAFAAATSPSSPCTLACAMLYARQGNVVECSAGIYGGTAAVERLASSFEPANSGTVTEPIIFYAVNPAATNYGQPSLYSELRKTDGASTGSVIGTGDQDYIVLDGFFIDEVYVWPQANGGCVLHGVGSTGCSIRRFAFDRTGANAQWGDYSGDHNANCIYFESAFSAEVLDCYFEGGPPVGSHNNAAINVYNSPDYLIQNCHFQDALVAFFSKENCARYAGIYPPGNEDPANLIAVVKDDGGTFTEHRDDVSTQMFSATEAVDDAIYFGMNWLWRVLRMNINTQGVASAPSTVWEYYNGSGWSTLPLDFELGNSGNGAYTEATGLGYYMYWQYPGDWARTSITNQAHVGDLYYIRCRVIAANYSTVPVISGWWADECQDGYLTSGEVAYNYFNNCIIGIETQQGVEVLMHHNLVVDAVQGWRTDSGPGRKGNLEWSFYNNTIVFSGDVGDGVYLEECSSMANCEIYDNIFYSPTSQSTGHMVGTYADQDGGWRDLDWTVFTQWDYNCYYSPGTIRWQNIFNNGNTWTSIVDWRSNSGHDANAITSDPEFVDRVGGDFRLASNGQGALTGSTGSPMGCYQTGNEEIGIRATPSYT